MKYIAVHASNGYCGCDLDDLLVLDDSFNDEEIAEMAWEMAVDNAESYSYVHFGWGDSFTDEEYDEYINEYVTVDWHKMTYDECVDYCNNYNIEMEG